MSFEMEFDLPKTAQRIQSAARELAQTQFCDRAAAVDQTEQYPWDNVRALVSRGLMGHTVSADYGGGGGALIDAIVAIEEVAKACGTTARIVVEGNVGAVGAIGAYGTDDQKARYLPLVVAGDKPAICITEPQAGSAATDLTTTAVRDGDSYIVDGQKRWITGAGVSKTYLIFARIQENGHDFGIGGILTEADTPGLEVGKRWPIMGLRGLPECDVHFRACRAAADDLLVREHGFRRLMTAYNGQRLGAATVALGIAAGAFDQALAYSQDRQQFGRPLSDFQGLQWMLADMTVSTTTCRALIYQAAKNAGHGFPDSTEAAVAKVYASEMAIQVTNAALQLFGAYGYSREFPLERMVRDARMFTIGGGTAQLQRNLIASKILGRRLDQRLATERV